LHFQVKMKLSWDLRWHVLASHIIIECWNWDRNVGITFLFISFHYSFSLFSLYSISSFLWFCFYDFAFYDFSFYDFSFYDLPSMICSLRFALYDLLSLWGHTNFLISYNRFHFTHPFLHIPSPSPTLNHFLDLVLFSFSLLFDRMSHLTSWSWK